MSDFSSLKSVPPVFQKSNLEKTWKNLQHPFSLAIFASVGVHGLLWFGLPLMSFSNPKPPNEQSLEVIELSPLEQSRLPDTTLSLPLKSAPNNLPKLTDPLSSPLSSIPSTPTLNDPIPFYQIPGLSATSGYVNDSVESSGDSYDKLTQRPKPDTSRTTTSRVILEEEDKAEAQKTDETNQDKTDKLEETQTETPPVSHKADDLKQPSGEVLSTGQEAQQQAFQQKYAYSTEGTSDTDILKNAQTASETISAKFSVRDWEKAISATAAYPQEACQFQHEGQPVQGATKLAVVLQPDGQLADVVLMLGSSGYKGLDEAAIQFVEKEWPQIASQNKVEPGSQPKAFPLSIKFDPANANCADAQKVS